MVATMDGYLKDIPFNFLDRYLGGTDLRITSKVAYNGLSLPHTILCQTREQTDICL
jgi:hypothetical protein